MNVSLFDTNHLNTMIGENKAENNMECRYRRPTP